MAGLRLRERISRALSRRWTILVVPRTGLKPRRLEATPAFLLSLAAIWLGVTAWAVFVSGRSLDYALTKADNRVLLAKMTGLAAEMRDARRILDQAGATDREMRGLLVMARGHDAAAPAGVGGPTLADRLSLDRLLAGDARSVNQPAWHREIASLRRDARRRLASFQEIAWYVGNRRSLRNATPTLWPADGRVTSLFGYRLSPMGGGDVDGREFHPGIDIAGEPDALIHATADGTVRFAGWTHGYGNMVVIDHGYGLSTLYAHASKLIVRAGDRVSRGQPIAYMGTTGRSTGAHVHYEVRRQDVPVNPMAFLKVRAGGWLSEARTGGRRRG